MAACFTDSDISQFVTKFTERFSEHSGIPSEYLRFLPELTQLVTEVDHYQQVKRHFTWFFRLIFNFLKYKLIKFAENEESMKFDNETMSQISGKPPGTFLLCMVKKIPLEIVLAYIGSDGNLHTGQIHFEFHCISRLSGIPMVTFTFTGLVH